MTPSQTEAADRVGEALAHLLDTVALIHRTGDPGEVSRLLVAAGQVEDAWSHAHATLYRHGVPDAELSPIVHDLKARAGEHIATTDHHAITTAA